MSDDCACGLDGELRACINGAVYGPCEHKNCGGICEFECLCDHECHQRTGETPGGGVTEQLPADFHKLYPDEFEEAFLESVGAISGWMYGKGEMPPTLTENLRDAYRHAAAAVFNRGVMVGRFGSPTPTSTGDPR